MTQQHRVPVVVPAHDPPPRVRVPENVLTAMPGKVVVQMYPVRQPKSGLVLPEGYAHPWVDTGVVLAVGCDPGKDSPEDEVGKRLDPSQDLKPGDRVIVDPYCGKAVRNMGSGDWHAATEVRFYGCEGGQMLDFELGDATSAAMVMAYDEQLHAVLDGKEVRPVGRKLIVRLDGLHEQTKGGVLLTLSQQTRDCVGLVVATGPLVTRCKPGDRVVFHEGGLRQGQRIDGTNDYFLLDWMVYAVVEG